MKCNEDLKKEFPDIIEISEVEAPVEETQDGESSQSASKY